VRLAFTVYKLTNIRYSFTLSHNFIHLLKRQHNYTQKNESEHLTNQQDETLKNATYRSQHNDDTLCSQKPKIFAEIYIFYC